MYLLLHMSLNLHMKNTQLIDWNHWIMCSPADVMLMNAAGQCKNRCDISVNDSRSQNSPALNTIKWCKLDATSSAPVKNTAFGRNPGFTTHTWQKTRMCMNTDTCYRQLSYLTIYCQCIYSKYWHRLLKTHTDERCYSHFWDRKPLWVSDAFRLSF